MFYCDFRDQHEQTTANIIGAILKQLLVKEEVLGHVQKAFQKAKTEVGGRGSRSATPRYGGHAEAGCCHITKGFHLY